ncbi:MAG: hypothetical protein LKJ47_01035 [Bifidobacteriaceae bacterium]|nr:hypothetical protein [Bifidobacteriaceae bacterium]
MPQAVKQLSEEKISEIRSLRRASIRRRQILVGSLLLVAVALVVLGIVLHFSPLFALIPVALIAVVLFFGARAAKVARAWEESVASGGTTADSSDVESSHVTDSITVSTPEAAGLSPAGHEVLETAPTYVIPVNDVREVLRKQAQEKAAAIAKRHDAREARAAAKLQAAAQVRAAEEVVAEAAADESGKVTEAPSYAPKSAPAPTSEAEAIEDGNADDETTTVNVVAKAAAQADTRESTSDKDLISFSLGESEVPSETDTVKSAEIKSYKQVSKAVPKSREEQKAMFADVAPSETELASVAAPEASSDSLGVDVDAVLARRQS